MEHNNTYAYAYQPRQTSPSTASSKSTGAYQNSSAFSASANPDEDWTKISDLAERRRIQNRIAQRNYRKKLKRRLEDLERRTTSSSASPEQTHRELVKPDSVDVHVPVRQNGSRRVSAGPRTSLLHQEQQYQSDLHSSGESWVNHASEIKQIQSFSSPSTYSFADSYVTADYFPDEFTSTQYGRMPMMYTNPGYASPYVQSISPSLPSVVSSESYKTEDAQYSGGELLTPFNLNYASLAGYNVPTTNAPSDFASRTPPLTASSLYFDSKDCLPSQFALPMTPASRSTSPNIALFNHIEV